MKLFYSLILLLIISVIFAVVLTFVYIILYNNYLSKRVKNGIKTKDGGRRHVEPFNFFLICFFVILILSCLVLSVNNDKKLNAPESPGFEICADNSYADSFSCSSELPGYTRYEKVVDDISCVYYINNNKNSAFPAMYLYIGYKGKYSFTYYSDETKKASSSDISISGENAGWYALNDMPDSDKLFLDIKTGSASNTIEIKL